MMMGYPGPAMGASPVPASMGGSGIDALASVSELWIQQKVDLFEVFTGMDISNVYNIFRSKNEKESNMRWMMAMEKSDCCCRVFLKSRRELTMDIGMPFASAGQTMEQKLGLTESATIAPIIKIQRPFTCCLTEMTVSDGNNQVIGKIDEECTNMIGCCPVTIKATDASGAEMYNIKGPCRCWMDCCMQMPCREPYDFEVRQGDAAVGRIQNVPNGWCKMCFTNADEYAVSFPPTATPQQRAMILATVFLLDYSFFESKQNNNNDSGVGMAI